MASYALGVTLAGQRHHEWHLVDFERIVDVVRVPPDIPNLQERFARQLALNGKVLLVVSSRPVLRVNLVCRIGLRLVRSGETFRHQEEIPDCRGMGCLVLYAVGGVLLNAL